jgi:hypothetical protein
MRAEEIDQEAISNEQASLFDSQCCWSADMDEGR